MKAIEELGPNPEITRFKGLGEISPDEFKHFIGKDMRLEQVSLRKTDLVKSCWNSTWVRIPWNDKLYYQQLGYRRRFGIMRRAIFPGTFDPFTIGHSSVVSRALTFIDEIVIGIGINENKNTYFPLEKREQ